MMNINNLAPIALFVFNRLEHTKVLLKSLLNNDICIYSDLIIFSDASKSKNINDISKVQEVRNYIKSISGFKTVKIIERECNFGLAKSLIEGVTQVVNQYGKIIVLEDDLLLSPYFLKYMNEALELYKNDENVISIHGYCYPIKNELPETFFIKGADCWGWATWSRGWSLFEKDGQILLNQLNNKRIIKEFNFNNTYDYYQMLKDQILNKNNSWAIRWYASAFIKNKLTLYPYPSLVHNTGNDSSGTHCDSTNLFDNSLLADKYIELKKIPIEENKYARRKFELFLYRLNKNILYNRLNIIKTFIKKLFSLSKFKF